jgi:hypothetical protein
VIRLDEDFFTSGKSRGGSAAAMWIRDGVDVRKAISSRQVVEGDYA